jgi:hypothetical protein
LRLTKLSFIISSCDFGVEPISLSSNSFLVFSSKLYLSVIDDSVSAVSEIPSGLYDPVINGDKTPFSLRLLSNSVKI